MARAYRYIYYRIYAWNLRAWGESDLPQFNACMGLAFLVLINLMSALKLAGVSGLPYFNAMAVALFGTILFAHYLYFVRRRRYLTLEPEFRAKPFLAPGMGLALVWGYVAGSLGLFFGLLSAGASRSAV